RSVIAGVQRAVSGALRLGDVVVVEGEWGRVEEITLTYVVVRIWDGRRLVLPSSYFTDNPFQNWTRTEAAVMGTVFVDVDWTVPVAAMRAELLRILEGTKLWDRRVGVLQVTDVARGLVQVRCAVSAARPPALR